MFTLKGHFMQTAKIRGGGIEKKIGFVEEKAIDFLQFN